MNREEYAALANGFTSVSFQRIITVLPENSMPYTLKYSDISELLKYPKIKASMCQGDTKRRTAQLGKLGYKVHKILWQGEEKHSPTAILFVKEELL